MLILFDSFFLFNVFFFFNGVLVCCFRFLLVSNHTLAEFHCVSHGFCVFFCSCFCLLKYSCLMVMIFFSRVLYSSAFSMVLVVLGDLLGVIGFVLRSFSIGCW